MVVEIIRNSQLFARSEGHYEGVIHKLLVRMVTRFFNHITLIFQTDHRVYRCSGKRTQDRPLREIAIATTNRFFFCEL